MLDFMSESVLQQQEQFCQICFQSDFNKIVMWKIYADKCQVASPKKQAKNKPK